MERFKDYRDRYTKIDLSRDEAGVLLVRFHTDGGPMVWGIPTHHQVSDAFARIARDPDNRVVVLTGTGDSLIGPRANPDIFPHEMNTSAWEDLATSGWQLTWSLLSIDAPVICCVNGPIYRHPEIPLLSDVVLACPEAAFLDSGHFLNNIAPGDGIGLFLPLLMGHNRGRYVLLTGKEISAQEALNLGLVAELHPRETLLDRGMDLARQFATRSTVVLRSTRRIFMQPIKEIVLKNLGYGLAQEGLGIIHQTSGAFRPGQPDPIRPNVT